MACQICREPVTEKQCYNNNVDSSDIYLCDTLHCNKCTRYFEYKQCDECGNNFCSVCIWDDTGKTHCRKCDDKMCVNCDKVVTDMEKCSFCNIQCCKSCQDDSENITIQYNECCSRTICHDSSNEEPRCQVALSLEQHECLKCGL